MSVQQLQREVLALPAAEQHMFVRWARQLDLASAVSADVLRDGAECPIWSPYGCTEAGEALLAALKEESAGA